MRRGLTAPSVAGGVTILFSVWEMLRGTAGIVRDSRSFSLAVAVICSPSLGPFPFCGCSAVANMQPTKGDVGVAPLAHNEAEHRAERWGRTPGGHRYTHGPRLPQGRDGEHIENPSSTLFTEYITRSSLRPCYQSRQGAEGGKKKAMWHSQNDDAHSGE